MTPQEVLGISPSASLDDAESAYHQLLRHHHPDLHQGAGPDAIAAAEARTRALNSAIHRIRSSASNAHAANAAEQQAYARQQREREQFDRQQRERAQYERQQEEFRRYQQQQHEQQPHEAQQSHANDDGRTETFSYNAKPIAVCPFCNLQFEASAVMKEHVWWDHGVKLDYERRNALLNSRFRSRWHRAIHGLVYLSPWYLLPFNLVVALMFAVPTRSLDTYASYWIFAVVMGPTVVLFTARGFRKK